jgi:hypothetical protein
VALVGVRGVWQASALRLCAFHAWQALPLLSLPTLETRQSSPQAAGKTCEGCDVGEASRVQGPWNRAQVTVIGLQFGQWGIEKYGAAARKVDALDFYADRLQKLRSLVVEQQEVARDMFVPTAFVTFKCALLAPHSNTVQLLSNALTRVGDPPGA